MKQIRDRSLTMACKQLSKKKGVGEDYIAGVVLTSGNLSRKHCKHAVSNIPKTSV